MKIFIILAFYLLLYIAKIVPNPNTLKLNEVFKIKVKIFKNVNIFDKYFFLGEVPNRMYLQHLFFNRPA
jgi:hypothetical protein